MTRHADAQVPGRRYDGTAIALHWITAILIVANLTVGLSMVGLPISPRKLHWYLWHKSIGVTIFVLTSARLFWRVLHPPPPPVPMPRWQQRASALSHGALYALLSNFTDPRALHWSLSGNFVIMAVLGGMRSFWGPLIGAAIFVVLQDYVSSHTQNWMSVIGLFFVLVVSFFPRGVLGVFKRKASA